MRLQMRNVLSTTLTLPALLLISCSRASTLSELPNSHAIKAVEVGNPEDTAPGKQAPQQPSRAQFGTTVKLDLAATDLEEIDRIAFQLKQAQIRITNQDGTVTLVEAVPEEIKAAFWTIQSGSTRSFSSVLSGRAFSDAKSLHMILTFNQTNPGQVVVGTEIFAIDPQVQPLILPIQLERIQPSGTAEIDVTTVAVEVTKASLFSTETSREPVGGATGTPSNSRAYTLKTQ